MTDHQFDTPEPIELVVEIGRGAVRIAAAETATTEIEVSGSHADDVAVTRAGDVISVIGPRGALGGLLGGEPRLDVVVSLPTDSRLVARLGSADLHVSGAVGASRLKTGSGDLTLETLTDAGVVQTGSGDITVHRAEGNLKVQTGSGDVSLGTAGSAVSISTGSGDIHIEDTAAPTVVKTGSGDLVIGLARSDASFTTGSGDLRIREAVRGRIGGKCGSGDVQIGVRAGVPVWTDVHTVSGRIRSTLQGAGQPEPGQDHLELRTSTISGDIVLAEV